MKTQTRATVILLLGLGACAPKGSSILTLDKAWTLHSTAEPEKTYEASVPSTVIGTLCADGEYQGLLERDEYKKADKTRFDLPWVYSTEFDKPRSGKYHQLLLEGLSYRADVYLNSVLLAGADEIFGPFREFRLRLDGRLKDKDNKLEIKVYRAQKGEPNIGFVDWNPRPLDESMGLYKAVKIISGGPVEISAPFVRTVLDTVELNSARLSLGAMLRNLSDKPISGKFKVEIYGVGKFVREISLDADESREVLFTPEDEAMLLVKNPRLWWCRGLGKAEMYSARLSFRPKNDAPSSASFDFGIRQIDSYFTPEGHRGFLLNGRKVLVRGAGWTDDIFLRNTPEDYARQISYVADMNLNAIRLENFWGTSDALYSECDRQGILMLVGLSCQWEWEEYLGSPCDMYGGINSPELMNLVAESLKDRVLALRAHPSIIAWYTGSDKLPNPELEKMYRDYCFALDERDFVCSAKAITSSVSGPSGMKMVGPYDYVSPSYWYSPEAPGGNFGFNTETGIGAQLPVKESLEKTLGGKITWPADGVWDYHCTASKEDMHSLDVLKDVVSARYGEAADADDFLKKAQLLDYEGSRAMFESFRRGVPRATGLIAWMLNSAWPSLYWQLYDYYGQPTAGYYGVKAGNAPLQLIYDYYERKVFAVCSGEDSPELTAEAVIWRDGIKSSLKKTLKIPCDAAVEVFDIGQSNSISFLFLKLSDESGEISRNEYVLAPQEDVNDWAASTWIRTPLAKAADFSALSDMDEAELSASATKKNGMLEVELRNLSDKSIAFFNRLSLKDKDGELLCPVLWEDNYFSLQPGERRTLKATLPTDGPLTLHYKAWNSPEKTLQI